MGRPGGQPLDRRCGHVRGRGGDGRGTACLAARPEHVRDAGERGDLHGAARDADGAARHVRPVPGGGHLPRAVERAAERRCQRRSGRAVALPGQRPALHRRNAGLRADGPAISRHDAGKR